MLLLKILNVPSWFSIENILGYRPHNLTPEMNGQNIGGRRNNNILSVEVPNTVAWNNERLKWGSTFWGVSDNNPFSNTSGCIKRANFYYLAYKHYTNEEKTLLISGILNKLNNATANLNEKEVGCIKHICKNNVEFALFKGGSNDQPIVRGENTCNTNWIQGV